jgi:hypothetical protein
MKAADISIDAASQADITRASIGQAIAHLVQERRQDYSGGEVWFYLSHWQQST